MLRIENTYKTVPLQKAFLSYTLFSKISIIFRLLDSFRTSLSLSWLNFEFVRTSLIILPIISVSAFLN
jgi:hypothetical protein